MLNMMIFNIILSLSATAGIGFSLHSDSRLVDEGLWWEDARYPEDMLLEAYPEDMQLKEALPWKQRRVSVSFRFKLAFLLIEKNAGTQFNNLMAHMDGKQEGWPWAGATSPHIANLSYTDLTHESGWRWAVFLRDPMARYLSAWGSKCMMREDDGENCLASDKAFSSANATLHDQVRSFTAHLQQAWMDMKVNQGSSFRGNPHWETQTAFFDKIPLRINDFDFVGHLRGDVNGQVREMLRMVGAPEDASDTAFPKDHVEGHQSGLGAHMSTFYAEGNNQTFHQLWYGPDLKLPGL
mmetsp:Transcript_41238/g.93001  ORF Transcript_41238/g.93001 Transcript_41238/m.93001 type:complete len:295 (-) Transcript_41238:195-1079(-)